ncbi:MAG TPA: hypothetical protein VKU85_15255, partial [bacterium]|nr:hypothetical protein [bacterium]
EAQLLLAAISWERNDVKRAREYVTGLAESAHLPSELKGGALILEADCAWAQGHIQDSERLYRRALQERLDREEASWATLQLGNAARRGGQPAVALDRYRESHERWPDTFYGSQAGWFLRLAERAEEPKGAAKETGAVEDHG